MRRHPRRLVAAIAIVVMALSTASLLAPAASAANAHPAASVLSASATTTTTPPPPSTSPVVVPTRNPEMPKSYQCATGYLCAYVHNGWWYDFNFYYCKLYSLREFVDLSPDTDTSLVLDYQTPGTTTTFYGKTGNVLQTVVAPSNFYVLPGKGGWNPVYSIKIC
jgi:hypothetical protein